MKYCFLILALLLLPLTACGGMPTAASAPSPTLFTATQPPPSETPNPASTETQPAPTVETKSYLSQLDIVFESPEQQLKYNGAEIGGQTSVDRSAASHGIHEVTMTPELQAKLSMRALHNIFMPEEEDNDVNLAAFTKKLANVQAGNGSCADFVRTISIYDINGSGAPSEITIVPACRLSPVPEGAMEIKSVNFVTGSWYVWSEELGKHIANPDYTWYEVVIAGGGGGILFDKTTNTLEIMVGLPFQADAQNRSGWVSTQIEDTLAWLSYYSLGKSLTLSSDQKYYLRGQKWASDLQVK